MLELDFIFKWLFNELAGQSTLAVIIALPCFVFLRIAIPVCTEKWKLFYAKKEKPTDDKKYIELSDIDMIKQGMKDDIKGDLKDIIKAEFKAVTAGLNTKIVTIEGSITNFKRDINDHLEDGKEKFDSIDQSIEKSHAAVIALHGRIDKLFQLLPQLVKS